MKAFREPVNGSCYRYEDAANALRWCVNEMERRYKLMSALGVRNLAGYNEKIAEADRMMRPLIPDPYWKPVIV